MTSGQRLVSLEASVSRKANNPINGYWAKRRERTRSQPTKPNAIYRR
jgi:hypothetical protein